MKKRLSRKKRRPGKKAPRVKSLGALLEHLQGAGRYSFAAGEALKALGVSSIALRSALWRLARSRRVASPRRGFYVIVPPEHRAVGCPSPEWFIDDLMAYLGRPYYVGLLTAAALHGAAHQAPQEFQVVTDRRLPMIRIGRARIRFVKKARVATTPTVRINTPTGQMRVSIPEATAIDLVRYPEHAGFLSNVATVLRELVERVDRRGLLRAATTDGEAAYAQRLGYLLDLVGRGTVAEPLAEWIAARAPRVTPLTPGLPITGMPRNLRWRVAVNDQVEADEGMA